MKTVKILNEKQAEIEGVTYPIRKVGDTYRVYIADETLYGRHWIVVGKVIADYVATEITFDETKMSARLGVPSGATGTRTPRITIEKLLEVLDEETRQKVNDAIAKITADSKAEREKAIKASKIAKYQAMIDALMAE